MNALQLTQIDFDGLENRVSGAIRRKVLGVFVDAAPEMSAWSHLDAYVNAMKPIKPYLGWDLRIYPRFEVAEMRVNTKPECA